MSHSFLCANYRSWLNRSPKQASHCYSSACDTGWILYQDKCWSEALSFLGVAYEAAEILMSNKVIKQDMAMNYFLYSLAGLTQTMIKLDQLHACKEIYINAIERLKKERGHDPENKIYLRTEINRLSHELANLYSGKAIFNYAYYANAFTPNEWNTTLH